MTDGGEEVFGAANAFARDHAGAKVEPQAAGSAAAPAAPAAVAAEAPTVPYVRLPGQGTLLASTAKEIGGILTRNGVYRRDMTPVTVNKETGAMEPMVADRFRSYVEDHMVCFVDKTVPNVGTVKVPTTMPVEVSRGVLAADHFVFQQRRIQKVNMIRQPVRRKDGRIELLGVGYDREAETLTLESAVEIRDAMTFEEAKAVLRDILREFPFADTVPSTDETVKDGTAGQSRSMAVQVASMLALFAGGLVSHDARRLNFVWSANKPRSGKTLLAQMGIVPTMGSCNVQALPDTREELRKVLDSEALAASSYILFDDLKDVLSNQALNAFMTASTWTGRLMNSQRKFTVPKIATLFITGNNLSLSADIAGRTLLCEIYVQEADAQDRDIARPIDEEWLARTENRSTIVSALWALVREWDKAGRPKGPRVLKGFEAWSSIFGGIVSHAGFGDPCAAPKTECSGSAEEQDMRALVAHFAEGLAKKAPMIEVDFEALIAACQKLDAFSYWIDGKFVKEDEEQVFRLTQKSNATMGKLFAGRYGGNVFRLPDGRRIRFGNRGRNRHRKYQIEWLLE